MLDVTILAGSGIRFDLLKPDLVAVAKNVIWFNVSQNGLTEKDLDFLPAMINLEKLRLEKNPLTDAIGNHLTSLHHLEAVNLNETKITNKCMAQLSQMPNLKRVYHWRTLVE
jgi:Leucine-rich repeat (LRR) protein